MPGAKYEQLASKPDIHDDVLTTKPKGKWSEVCFQKGILSLGLILLYFSLSIGLTFYQRWLLKVSSSHLFNKLCYVELLPAVLCGCTHLSPDPEGMSK